MSQHLEGLKLGETIDVRGPNGLIVYQGNGDFAIRPKKNQPPVLKNYKKVFLVFGKSRLAVDGREDRRWG